MWHIKIFILSLRRHENFLIKESSQLNILMNENFTEKCEHCENKDTTTMMMMIIILCEDDKDKVFVQQMNFAAFSSMSFTQIREC